MNIDARFTWASVDDPIVMRAMVETLAIGRRRLQPHYRVRGDDSLRGCNLSQPLPFLMGQLIIKPVYVASARIIVAPSSAGDGATKTPADWSASIFAAAVSPPCVTIA